MHFLSEFMLQFLMSTSASHLVTQVIHGCDVSQQLDKNCDALQNFLNSFTLVYFRAAAIGVNCLCTRGSPCQQHLARLASSSS